MQLNRPIAGSARKEPKKTYGFVALDERLFPERISSGLIEAGKKVDYLTCGPIFPERISSGLIEARSRSANAPRVKHISGAN